MVTLSLTGESNRYDNRIVRPTTVTVTVVHTGRTTLDYTHAYSLQLQ